MALHYPVLSHISIPLSSVSFVPFSKNTPTERRQIELWKIAQGKPYNAYISQFQDRGRAPSYYCNHDPSGSWFCVNELFLFFRLPFDGHATIFDGNIFSGSDRPTVAADDGQGVDAL